MAQQLPTSRGGTQRNDSIFSRSSSVASEGSGSSSKKWKPSWRLSRTFAPGERSSSLSRKPSSSTTASSRYSTSTQSSNSTGASGYQHDGVAISKARTGSASSQTAFDSVSDATLALQSLTTTVEVDEDGISAAPNPTRPLPTKDKELPLVPKRSESRARSTNSKLSAIQRDPSAALAEIEMVGKEYKGYWRATFTARLPPAAALVGSMLLTARLPAHRTGSTIAVNSESMEWARSLCEWLEEAETPDEALAILQRSSFETTVLALRASFDARGMPSVPDKLAWAMYQRISEVKNHPSKLGELWGHISKLLKKVPEEIMCLIMFCLTIARRLQSRGVTIEDRPPGVFLLRDFFPRFAGEDMSKLLLKNYELLPHDLPLILESVNYTFGASRRYNVLALVASKKHVPANGVQESRTSEDHEPE